MTIIPIVPAFNNLLFEGLFIISPSIREFLKTIFQIITLIFHDKFYKEFIYGVILYFSNTDQ